ncbi:IS3 family transposase [Paenibacillus larvae]|uniref:IS3 family transposase n=1 Tax=Paenibacillus larvae TaxID=1464 RepID=UPI0037CC21CE
MNTVYFSLSTVLLKVCLGVSRCLDNQPIERFWGTFKAESFYLRKHDTYEDVLKDVRNYIHYYNNYRYTERLSGLSPSEYRRKQAHKNERRK